MCVCECVCACVCARMLFCLFVCFGLCMHALSSEIVLKYLKTVMGGAKPSVLLIARHLISWKHPNTHTHTHTHTHTQSEEGGENLVDNGQSSEECALTD